MMESVHSCTTFFNNYEEREDAFRQLVDFKLARRYGGPALFWKDFSLISRNIHAASGAEHISSITSNPRDCLAFATARQVLMAALMSAGEGGDEDQVIKVLSRFGIADQIAQPIRTLSGGETVKLALAKTSVTIPTCSKIVISSPFAWLSSGNRHVLEELVLECIRIGKEVSILALEGEDDLSFSTRNDSFSLPDQRGVLFSLTMSDVRIPLSLSINPLSEPTPHAAIADTCLQLESPCLLEGDNGQGKSLIARALAGSLPLQGKAAIEGTGSGGGKASLLFQDVLVQTLLRSFDVLAGGGRGLAKSAAFNVYNNIREEYNHVLDNKGVGEAPFISDVTEAQHSLLDIKTILVAVRLAAFPAALILDEPDWGLSRKSGIAFVSAVLSVAHKQGTPVLLISHKPWWRSIVRSSLTVSRTMARSSVPPDASVFTISLNSRGSTS